MHQAKIQISMDIKQVKTESFNTCAKWVAKDQCKKKGKDQESIQSSTTPVPGYQWESDSQHRVSCHYRPTVERPLESWRFDGRPIVARDWRYFFLRAVSGESASFNARVFLLIIFSEYDQEIPQSQTADKPMAPRGRVKQQSRDTRKTY